MTKMLMHTAARGKVCCVTGAVLGTVTTEPTRIPAAVGCCTTLPTGCAATEAPSWTDDDDVISCGSTGTGAADEGSTGGRTETDIGGGGRTPSMCILFKLSECRSNGKLFYNTRQNNKFTTVTNILAVKTMSIT